MKKGVYPGSFDPLTLGHLDVITRASELVDELYVIVADNPKKKFSFSLEKRLEMINKVIKHLPNVKVTATDDLVVRFAAKENIKLLFRGLRNIADYEYEYQLYQFNRNLNPDVETVVLFPSSRNHFVSSSSIKELVYHGADISLYIPEEIVDDVIDGLPRK
ncbi:pantetheine-phosphate adenylyltransferase [Acholeplasma hippikon]|uniref:Phosphopantetheine adenylyltransferase n=1 Tax=Acholeplasma hippikon TaxID=264636 RepID=A0A449BK27_9MOLU|nr:pantetheine-phosphate adenylyltransferase [Acholeplasma hippikon]VEU82677.1 phosphopantetheine adenylyltransferase [Acholeplasma hippikon]